ncbi:MAG: preprotein translocase subunit YajC [Thermoleophilia bacterium]|nr:preprotein translocase subunit YajC [Thermoleophilia bacterium]
MDNGLGLLLFLAVAGLLMFVMTVPQRRLAKQHKEMVSHLKPGDEVVTLGGIYGTITEVEDGDTLLLEISEDTDIRVSRASVGRIVTPAATADEAAGAPPAADGAPE